MKTYIGVKRIQAGPCERNGVPGYKVVYEPDGYESWSPKDVFERAYFQVDGHDKLTEGDVERFFDAGAKDYEERPIKNSGDSVTGLTFTAPTGFVLTNGCAGPGGRLFATDHLKYDLEKFLEFVRCWAANGLKK